MILLVEDSLVYSKYLEYKLSGFTLDFANNIEEAKKKNFDDYEVVVLDHFLPDGTSLDLLSEIKTLTPIIVLTMDNEDNLKDEVLKEGAFAFLCKERSEFIVDLVDVSIRHKKRISQHSKKLHEISQKIRELLKNLDD